MKHVISIGIGIGATGSGASMYVKTSVCIKNYAGREDECGIVEIRIVSETKKPIEYKGIAVINGKVSHLFLISPKSGDGSTLIMNLKGVEEANQIKRDFIDSIGNILSSEDRNFKVVEENGCVSFYV
jgi:hypothetical protein